MTDQNLVGEISKGAVSLDVRTVIQVSQVYNSKTCKIGHF